MLACSVSPTGVPGLGTHTLTLLTGCFHPMGWVQCFVGALQACVGWCLWVPSHGMGSAVGWCLWVHSCGMGSAHPRLGACSPQLVAGRGPQSGQPHAMAPLPFCPLSHMVSSSLARPHAPSLSTILWHSPRPFIPAVAALCQARFCHQWVSHASTLSSALAGCWHPRWHPSTLGTPAPYVCCSPWLCPGSPQGNVPGGHGVFRKTGLGTCWPSQENKNIRAGSRTVSARGRHSINPLEQVLCSWHKEMSTLFSSA